MKHENLSFLFTERPLKYAYRGDYYFWEYLQQYFEEHAGFSTKEDIINTLKQQFKEQSGIELTEDAMPYVQKFANGGMSSGFLSGDFWLNSVIPMLLKRFDESTD